MYTASCSASCVETEVVSDEDRDWGVSSSSHRGNNSGRRSTSSSSVARGDGVCGADDTPLPHAVSPAPPPPTSGQGPATRVPAMDPNRAPPTLSSGRQSGRSVAVGVAFPQGGDRTLLAVLVPLKGLESNHVGSRCGRTGPCPRPARCSTDTLV